MSLILLEGFDDGIGALKWTSFTPKAGPGAGQGRHQSGIQINDTGLLTRALSNTEESATMTLGLAVRKDNAGSSNPVDFQWWGDAGAIQHLNARWLAATNRLEVRRGASGGTLLGTTDVLLTGTAFHYLEIRVVIDDVAGVVESRIDGAVVLDLAGIDTRNGGVDALVDLVRIDGIGGGSAMSIDDIYLTNGGGAAPYNGFLGDVIVDTLLPNGNGASSGFTGSDANQIDNYLLVDEAAPDGETTYVHSTANGQIDLYGFDDLAFATGVIRGVVVSADARHEGAAQNGRVKARITGVNYDGTTQALAAGFDDLPRHVWQTSPASATHWTVGEINAAEFGIEAVV